jgi:hypothetical protein
MLYEQTLYSLRPLKKETGVLLLLNCDQVLSLCNEEEFPCKCGQEDQAMKEVCEGWASPKRRCDLDQGKFSLVVNKIWNPCSN